MDDNGLLLKWRKKREKTTSPRVQWTRCQWKSLEWILLGIKTFRANVPKWELPRIFRNKPTMFAPTARVFRLFSVFVVDSVGLKIGVSECAHKMKCCGHRKCIVVTHTHPKWCVHTKCIVCRPLGNSIASPIGRNESNFMRHPSRGDARITRMRTNNNDTTYWHSVEAAHTMQTIPK